MNNLTLTKSCLLWMLMLFSFSSFSQDIKIQHIQDDVDENGGTNTAFTSVSSLNNAFALALNNRKTHGGSVSSTTTLHADDLSGARKLTDASTLTYYRDSGSSNLDMQFDTAIWEYTGPSGGPNEFIVRGRYVVSLNGTTNSVTQALTGITNANNCIPFISGIMTSASSEGADSGTAIAYLEDSTTLRVQKGSNGNNVSVYVTVVEFTGANWNVYHADSGDTADDTGSMTLRADSDGTGALSVLSAWDKAIIFAQHRGDNTDNGTNDGIADNWPTIVPSTSVDLGLFTVDWAFNAHHESNGTNRQFVHVLENSGLNVTRYTNTSSASGESTVDITTASLSSMDQSLVIGTTNSSGTGTGYGIGWRNYYLNSITQAAHWCHKTGNTVSHRLQVVDFSDVKVTPGGIDGDLVLWLKADEGVEEAVDDLAEDNDDVSKWKGNTSLNNYAEYAGAGTPVEPVFRENEINFNPVVYIDGSDDSGLTMNSSITGNDKMTIFAVAEGSYTDPTSNTQRHLINVAKTSGRYLSVEMKTDTDELRARVRQSGNIDINLSSTEIVDEEPFLISHEYEGDTGNYNQLYSKGVATTSGTQSYTDEMSGFSLDIGIGKDPNRTIRPWKGGIAELIVFNSKPTTTERDQVESYLAIKYGFTLGVNGTSQDYVNSNGDDIWDATTNSGYAYNVAGIGRDDASSLNQKQSKTINTVDDITVGIKDIATTNKNNSCEFFNDRSFLLWGNDNGALTVASDITKDFSGGITGVTTSVTATPITRKWKMVVTDTVPTVKLSIPKSMVSATNPGDADEYIMIVADDASFSTNVTSATMKIVGDDLEVDFYFEGTKYITFGSTEITTETSRAASFERTDSYISAGDVNDLANMDYTISAWIKREPGVGKFDVVSKRNYFNEDISDLNNIVAGHYTVGYAFRVNQNGNLRMVWRDPDDSSNNKMETTANIPEDEWHHVCATYDMDEGPLGTTRLYIDGILVDTDDTNDPINFDNDSHFTIGAANHRNRQQKHNGSVDEVRVWNVELSAAQIQYVMNQEIEKFYDADDVMYYADGKVIPTTATKNEIGTVDWDNLIAYYPMSRLVFGSVKDESNSGNDASMINYNLLDEQTAPLPYKSTQAGAWDDENTWENGDVQYLPGVVSYLFESEPVDTDKITIDNNIVQIDHNVTMDNLDSSLIPNYKEQNRTVLGLIVNSGADYQIDGDTDAILDSDKGNAITISHYLKVDGTIDLEGESQLIQTSGSDLDTESLGALERDQQGTRDLYTYNYWSSPVGKINGGPSGVNNLAFELDDDNVLKNGTDPANLNDIVYTSSTYDGSFADPILTIADYWIWKYANSTSNDYYEWEFLGCSNPITIGEGYTMKGIADTGGLITQEQNYTFYGKPNNGDFTLSITAGNDYLVGNPYPSALDADEFIRDNISSTDTAGANNTVNVINGTLYFWDHFASSTHYLEDYEGGYATYTLMGAAVAVNNDTRINATGESGTKLPKRYIPVGQGFFVSAVLDADLIGESNDPELVEAVVGGNIEFKNSQRVFMREDDGTDSNFIRSSEVVNSSSEDIDTRQKIRLMYSSPEGFHRQLLVGVDENASDSFDVGYDGPLNETNIEDMYWVLNNGKLVIQAVSDFNTDRVLPLGVKTSSPGLITIKIDELENIDASVDIYLHDKDLSVYHDLRDSDYEIYLSSGNNQERFEITFDTEDTLSNNDLEAINLDVYFSNDNKSIVINNPHSKFIQSVEVVNVIGQSLILIESNTNDDYIEYKTNNIVTGIYIIKVKTDTGYVTKKVVVK
ncbi:LamG-like jellyroll fold domain-containing protein [Pontimicrobium sp. IMCC45349]|uniref:LamG-like jellyroll fold domain-containing protein n=1 Tax=Pontimicrobium sp. IMCC45349 TaxID=3391574 RepID=UPI0039A070C8